MDPTGHYGKIFVKYHREKERKKENQRRSLCPVVKPIIASGFTLEICTTIVRPLATLTLVCQITN